MAKSELMLLTLQDIWVCLINNSLNTIQIFNYFFTEASHPLKLLFKCSKKKEMLARVKLHSCLSDVITIDKTGENFRLLYDVKGRFTVHRITNEEAKVSLNLAISTITVLSSRDFHCKTLLFSVKIR